MKTSNTYQKYLTKIKNEVVIPSTFLSGLYGVNHDDFILKITDNMQLFPSDAMFFFLEGNIELNSKTPVAAFTDRGVALLSELYPGNKNNEINCNIIKTMIEMEDIVETSIIEEEIDLLSQQNINLFSEIQNRLKSMVDIDFEKTTEEFFAKFSSTEKQNLGLA
jgi:hypothetical protein